MADQNTRRRARLVLKLDREQAMRALEQHAAETMAEARRLLAKRPDTMCPDPITGEMRLALDVLDDEEQRTRDWQAATGHGQVGSA